MIVALVLYCIVSLILLFRMRKGMKYNGFPGAHQGFLLGCLIYYALVPFVIWVTYLNSPDSYSSWQYDEMNAFIFSSRVDVNDILFAIFYSILGLIGFEIAYWNSRRSTRTYIAFNDVYNDRLYKIVSIIANSTFCLGAFAVSFYIYAFGGLENALMLANILRQHDASITDYGISGAYRYFLTLSGMLTMTPVLYYFAWHYKKKNYLFLLIIISSVFTVIYFLVNNGKSAVLRLGVIFLYMFLFNRGVKRKSIWFIALVIIGLPAMSLLDAIFDQENLLDAISEFSFTEKLIDFAAPVELNYNMSDMVNKYGLKYFHYLFTDIIDILPGVSFEPSHVDTSEFIKGVDWEHIGGVPNDILTYGYWQLRGVGVIVIFYLWGKVSAWFDNRLGLIQDLVGKHLLSVVVCMNMVSLISCADISSTILYNFSFILTLLLLYYYNKQVK